MDDFVGKYKLPFFFKKRRLNKHNNNSEKN